MSSLLVGAGYSVLATPRSVVPSIATKSHEIVFLPLAETDKGAIAEEALGEALDRSAGSNVIVIGPGLGTDESTVRFVTQFIKQVTNRGDKVLLDGDALNILAMQKEVVLPLNSVITPHPKELARLMRVSVGEIQENRLDFAKKTAEQLNTTVVLKGAGTIIAQPDGSAYINVTGNCGMATAGSGDVLAGMIAGFMAQGAEMRDAAVLGVYLHGVAGDIAAKETNKYSLTAGMIMEYIPEAINHLIAGSED
jgi:NAD(P)H-hydrate epimerase